MIVAIVQARMRSARLPGKVMLEILGTPMLWYLIDRLRRSELVGGIVVATTMQQSDQAIWELAKEIGAAIYRGSEDNVLDRYYQTARWYRADIVVRITADCPLTDPELVDKIIEHYLANSDRLDYVCNGTTYPDGIAEIEVFPFNILERAWREAKLVSEKEHVTSYIWSNPQLFRIDRLEYEKDLSRMRLCVDDEKDFQLVSKIFENLYKEGEVFYLRDILEFLDKNPELLELNKGTGRDEGYLKSLAGER